MMAIFRIRSFSLLFLANLGSSFAGWAVGMALSVEIFERTRSAAAAGLLLIASTLPAAVLGSISGVVGDRINRRTLLLTTSIGRAGLVACLWLFPMTNALWLLYAVAVLQAATQRLFTPAEQRTIAAVVAPQHLLAANSANSVGTNTTRIAAPALGGLLIGVLGFGFTITVAVAALAGAAGLIALLPGSVGHTDADSDDSAGTALEQPSSVLEDWVDGIRQLRCTVDARAVASLQALDAVKEGIISTVFPVLLLGVIAASPAEMGLVNSSFAITAVLVAPFIPWIVKRSGYGWAVSTGAIITGLVMFPLVFWPSLWLTIATFLLAGAPFTVSFVSSNTLLITSVRESHRARAVGMMANIYAALMLATAAIAGLAADAIGVLPVLAVAATLQVLAGVSFVWIRRAGSSSSTTTSPPVTIKASR
jgi:MFS family permease